MVRRGQRGVTVVEVIVVLVVLAMVAAVVGSVIGSIASRNDAPPPAAWSAR